LKPPIPGMKPGSYIMLAMHDFGTGISPEIKAHIFEPFFTTKEQGKGTGLGLATVYAIVEQNGGYVECESDVGRGTTFKIYIPRCDDSLNQTASTKIENTALLGNETILVVEDEEMVRKLTCRILRDYGYQVISASYPSEALQICQNHEGKIHLLLSDVVMPGMNGVMLAGQLKEKYPAIKSLLMSGYTDSSYLDGRSELVSDFIQKPFKREALAAKVREILNRTNVLPDSVEKIPQP